MEHQYWVKHPELEFAPCCLKSGGDKGAVFEDAAGQEVKYDGLLADLAKVQREQLLGIDNVCDLEEVSRAALLHTVRVRYGQSMIYTRVARILIAVNPFKSLAIYSSQEMDKYQQASDSMELPPHVFGIGADAIKGLRCRHLAARSQAVLISGESGAGKTESTKLILSYVVRSLDDGQSGGMQDRIMETNPVLEAFGNAMTVRNNNSSRFGKWLQISVSRSMSVQGCSVTDYLLELTRVCAQGAKERNYHVFFQILQAREELKELGLGEPESYRYLQGAQTKAPGVDDARCFEELKDALTSLGFSDAVRVEIFRATAGVLALGNIVFTESDSQEATLADDRPLRQAADLLGLEEEELREPMLVRRITVGKEVTKAPRTAVQARGACDALARLIYGKVFKWLIANINAKLSDGGEGEDGGGGGAAASEEFFGLLDIAGFESFENNSLEQLFINLSNEHLQQHFNNHVFKMELNDYQAEGIDVGASLDFNDNSDIVTLIDSKTGLLSILDEEVAMPKASDETFLAKAIKAHEKHPRFVVPKFAKDLKFGIRHFAGEVNYNCESFLSKNIDKPPDEAPDLLGGSSNTVLGQIGEMLEEEAAGGGAGAPSGARSSVARPSTNVRASTTLGNTAYPTGGAGGGGGGGKSKPKTVSSGFRASLALLMQKLREADPHFVRCVKPNAEKVPDRFTSRLVMEQLNCSGVFEAVRIRQEGFASRVPFDELIARYRVVLPASVQKQVRGPGAPPDPLERARAFARAVPAACEAVCAISEAEITLGRTKFFCKARVVSALDRARGLAVAEQAVEIQCAWRGYRVRKGMRSLKEVFNGISEWQARNAFYTAAGSQHSALAKLQTAEAVDVEVAKVRELLARAEGLPLGGAKRLQVEKVASRMEAEAKEVRQLATVAGSLDPLEIDRVLVRVQELELPKTKDVEALMARTQKLKAQLPLISAIKDCDRKRDLAQALQIIEAVKQQGLDKDPELWIPELGGPKLLENLYILRDTLKAEKKQNEIKEQRNEEMKKQIEKTYIAGFEAAEEKAPVVRKKGSITVMNAEESKLLKLALEQAIIDFDAEALERNLGIAISKGLDEEGILKQAQTLFDNLAREGFITATLQEKAGELGKGSREDAATITCMQNLIWQADRIGVAEDTVAEARKKLREGVRRRARATVHGKIFDNIAADVDLLDECDLFYTDLANFDFVRPPAQWKGHRALTSMSKVVGLRRITRNMPSISGKVVGANQEAMFSHSSLEIAEGLSKLQPNQDRAAVQIFRDLLGWMGDRPMSDLQRSSLAQVILEAASTDTLLRDEVYLQVMKQLTNNPSSRSTIAGWKLMLRLCQELPPSAKLHRFVTTFVLRAVNGTCHESTGMAKQCMAELNSTTRPANDEEEVPEQESVVTYKIMLIDQSSRKVRAAKTCTLAHLRELLAAQLRLAGHGDFAFYQQIVMEGGYEVHRLMPDSAQLQQLFEKWEKLKRPSNLLFKRLLLNGRELLQPGDLVHATLTLRQALYEHLLCPVPEDLQQCCLIAATVLMKDRDHFSPYLRGSRELADPGILEQLIPEAAMRNEKRARVASMVWEAYHALQKSAGREEKDASSGGGTYGYDLEDTQAAVGKLASIQEAGDQSTAVTALRSVNGGEGRRTRQRHFLADAERVFTLLRRTKYFGAYHWPARQVLDVPEEKAVLPNAPSQKCKVNPKAPEAEYWVFLDNHGLRFVSVGVGQGQNFVRGFLFEEEAKERVIFWKAKADVIHFVVYAVEHSDSGSVGRVRMSITMSTAYAVDIAYAMDVVGRLVMRGGPAAAPAMADLR